MHSNKIKIWNIVQRLRMAGRGPKNLIRYWLKHQKIQYHNPHMIMCFPVALEYDNINAIKIGQVLIGAFSEICVLEKSDKSKTPGQLIIEDCSVIGSHANIRAVGGKIFIGRNALIAQKVSLIASNHTISTEQPYIDLPWDETKTGVFIDENVWIGVGVTVLPGCVIGKNSVIGAGSVVTKSIPANEVWVGVPARKLRDTDRNESSNCSESQSIKF